jgi:hypothetical protein
VRAFQFSGRDATLPTPTAGNTIRANFQCNVPIGAKDGEQFRPVLNGHGLFGTASQVNSDSLYALGSFGLMACATDEIGMAREDIPNAASALLNLSNFPSLPARLQQGVRRLPLSRARSDQPGRVLFEHRVPGATGGA